MKLQNQHSNPAKSPKSPWALLAVVGLSTPQTVLADGGFGEKSSVSNQLATDQAKREHPAFATESKGYYAYKQRVLDDTGLSFGGDLNLTFQHASNSPGPRDAAGSVLRLYGTWTFAGRGTPDTSALVFKFENRSKLGTDIAPQALGPTFGYAGLTSLTSSDAGWLLTNFYWQQGFNNNTVTLVAGIVDTTDYVDAYDLGNPWTGFQNLAFSTNPTIPVPNQGLGAAVRVRIGENHFTLAGIADANADPHDPGQSIENLFDTGETFKHIALGWVGSWDTRFDNNVQLTAWQVDDRIAAGVNGGWGVALSGTKKFTNGWSPFFRAGYADGGGAFVDRSVSIGTGYDVVGGRDEAAVGLNWGRAPKTVAAPNPRDQISVEAFYRYQPFSSLQITPGLQLIANPANNPAEDLVAVAGLRVRLTF